MSVHPLRRILTYLLATAYIIMIIYIIMMVPRADRNIGKYYSSFIFPYKGAFGSGSPSGTNKFWAVPGNHDVSCCWAASGSQTRVC